MTSGPPPIPDTGTVVGVDLRGIQGYVYGGQRILDAVGRSALVTELVDTMEPVLARLLAAEHGHVLRDSGGALTAVFAERARARRFTARYTRHLRERAGDLTPVVALAGYGPHAEYPDFSTALGDLPELLRRARAHQSAAHTPVHGYGITAACSVTGRPAEVVDPTRRQRGDEATPERVSADVARARRVGRDWHQRGVRALLDGAHCPGGFDLDLPTGVDELGRDLGDTSRIAVIHLDFNGLGGRLAAYERYASRDGAAASPDELVRARRTVSTQIAALTNGLARALVAGVAAAIEADTEQRPVLYGHGASGALRPHRDGGGTVQVPLRPIVVAGDDLTVVCDARLALSLVRAAFAWLDADPRSLADPADPRAALHATWLAAADGDVDAAEDRGWLRWAESDGGDHPTCVPTVGVGVAVHPTRAPMIVGYQTSEAMTALAKEHRRIEDVADHAVAWTQDFDGPDRAVARLRAARTAQPMLGADFTDFLHRYLSAHHPGSLRATDHDDTRSWLRSAVAPLLHRGGDLTPELDRRARLTGTPVTLPAEYDPGALLDAIALLDLHLDVPLGTSATEGEERRA